MASKYIDDKAEVADKNQPSPQAAIEIWMASDRKTNVQKNECRNRHLEKFGSVSCVRIHMKMKIPQEDYQHQLVPLEVLGKAHSIQYLRSPSIVELWLASKYINDKAEVADKNQPSPQAAIDIWMASDRKINLQKNECRNRHLEKIRISFPCKYPYENENTTKRLSASVCTPRSTRKSTSYPILEKSPI